MNKHIDSDIKTLRDIFKGKHIFRIPDFQRDFVWGENQVNKLFEDLAEDTNNFTKVDTEGYLLGNIVVINTMEDDVHYKDVIDGQQRLTVLSLIFYALGKTVKEINKQQMANLTQKQEDMCPDEYDEKIEDLTTWLSDVRELEIGYLLDSVKRKDTKQTIKNKLKLQHDPSLIIGEAYQNFFFAEYSTFNNDKNKEELNDAQTKIENVYDVIQQNIQWILKEENGEERVRNLTEYLRETVYLIETQANSLSKAFQLFEVLNERGVGLTPLDLIKNLLLKRLVTISNTDDPEVRNQLIQERREEFGKYWLEFIQLLEFKDKRRNPINSSTFLKHYLSGTKGIYVTNKNLFDYFSNLNLSSEDVIPLVKDFIRVLKVYHNLELKKYNSFSSGEYSQQLLKLIFESYKVKQVHSLLIPFYEEKQETKTLALKYITRLIAAIIHSNTSPSKLESIISQVNKKHYTSDEKDFRVYLDNLQSYTNEYAEQVKAVFPITRLQKRTGRPNDQATAFLEFIELLAFENNPFSSQDRKAARDFTLEHITPQTIDSTHLKIYGFEDEHEHKSHLNLCGNLALVSRSDNASMSNKKFEEKKKFFKTSKIYTTVTLSEPVPVLTKSGSNHEIYSTLNQFLYDEKLTKNKYWTKNCIKQRSQKIADYMYFLLTNKL